MRKIPQTLSTHDSFSTSNLTGTTTSSSTGSGNVGVGVTTVGGVLMSRVQHQSGFSYDNIYQFPGGDWDYMNGLDFELYAAETRSSGVLNASTDYIAREFIMAALYVNANGNSGTLSIAAYDETGAFVSRSQAKAFTGTQNGYVTIDWRHGLTLGISSIYYFRIEIQETDVVDLIFVDPQPFFAFHGSATTTTTPGTGGGGGAGALANLRDLYLSRYTHGAAEVVVDGTSIQDAIDSMPTDGGKILVKNGTYAPFNFINKSFTSYCSVMNFPGHTPHVSGLSGLDFQGLERACLIMDSDHVGVYGLEMSSINAEGHPYADVMAVSGSHHIAVWANSIHDGASGTGGVTSNHYDICYNRVYNCAGWLETFASGISLYQLDNIGGGDDSDGYSARIIGNICYNNFNDPSLSGITDGNGIIIDVANDTGYTGRVLIANNICVNNGGRGVHAFMSDNVDQWFNTSALNLRSSTMGDSGEIAQVYTSGGSTRYNISMPNTNRENWFFSGGALDPDNTIVLGGSLPAISGSNIDRTSTGAAYFADPSLTNPTAAGWSPITPDFLPVDSAVKTVLQAWPDAAGRYRPTTGNWTAGAIEGAPVTNPGGGGNGGGGVIGVPTTPIAPVYYPEDFGAVGDGITDDTNALQDCLDAIGSGTMYLAPGKVYVHTDVLTVSSGNINGGGYRSGNSIINAGRLHSTVPTASAVRFTGDNTAAYGVVFSSNATTRGVTYEEMKVLVFLTNGTVLHEIGVEGSRAAGIFIEGSSNYTVRSPVVKNTQADGIHNSGGSNNGLISDPYCENVGDDCFAVVTYSGQDFCHDITWLRPVGRGGKARGCAVVGGYNIIYRDIDIQGSYAAGIYLASEPPSSYDTRSTSNVVIENGVLRGCNTYTPITHGSIMFWDANQGVSNCSISNLNIYDTAGDAVWHIIANPGGSVSGCSLNSILVHAPARQYLVYDPDGVLSQVGVAYA